jgi:hypothetical protein
MFRRHRPHGQQRADDDLREHQERSARTGSMFVARKPGTKHAVKPATIITRVAMLNAIGSHRLTPNGRFPSSRVVSRASVIPIRRPATVSRSPPAPAEKTDALGRTYLWDRAHTLDRRNSRYSIRGHVRTRAVQHFSHKCGAESPSLINFRCIWSRRCFDITDRKAQWLHIIDSWSSSLARPPRDVRMPARRRK